MTEIINDIKPRLADSACVGLPFDEANKILTKAHYRIISTEENAALRIQEGINAFICNNGNVVREGFVYIPKEPHVYLTKSSPIMENPVWATNANRNKKEFFPPKDEAENAIDAIFSVKVPYEAAKRVIPTNRFGENEITAFVFGQYAEKYGDFLKEAGRKDLVISLCNQEYVDKQENPFATQLFFTRVGVCPDFEYYPLDTTVFLRGVRNWEAWQNDR